MDGLEEECGILSLKSSDLFGVLGLEDSGYLYSLDRVPLDTLIGYTLELSDIIKEFEEVVQKADSIFKFSVGFKVRRSVISKCMGASIPELILLPAQAIATFFEKRRGVKYKGLMKALGVHNFKQRYSSEKGSMIEVETLKLLSCDGGTRLVRHVGTENIWFKYGCSLVQAFEEVQKMRREKREDFGDWG